MQLPVSLSAFSRTCLHDVFQWDECNESTRVPFIVLCPQIGSNRITDDAFSYGRIWGGTGKCTFIWTDQKQADFRLKLDMRAAEDGALTSQKRPDSPLNIRDNPFLLTRCPWRWQLACLWLLNQSIISCKTIFDDILQANYFAFISSTMITSVQYGLSLQYLISAIIFQSHFTVRFIPNNHSSCCHGDKMTRPWHPNVTSSWFCNNFCQQRTGTFVIETCRMVSHQAVAIDRRGAKLEQRKVANPWTGPMIIAMKL